MNDIDSIITELCEQGAQAVQRYASVSGRLARPVGLSFFQKKTGRFFKKNREAIERERSNSERD